MSLSRSWQFVGGLNSPWYRFYDWLRQGVNRRMVDFLSRHLSRSGLPDRASCVLEAGSGPASASSMFARRSDVALAVCMDLDESAMREARRRDPAIPAVVGDLMAMPFADASFDLVFNSSTVEHLNEPERAVAEMGRVSNSGGRVFVGVPYLFGPLWFQPLIANTSVGVWLGTVFSRSSLDRMLSAAGLTPVRHLRYFWNMFVGAVATKSVAPNADAGSQELPRC